MKIAIIQAASQKDKNSSADRGRSSKSSISKKKELDNNPDGESGTVDVILDGTSTWTLIDDSYITSYDGDTANINVNGYHLYVAGEEVK